jgi:hypothetical protein
MHLARPSSIVTILKAGPGLIVQSPSQPTRKEIEGKVSSETLIKIVVAGSIVIVIIYLLLITHTL